MLSKNCIKSIALCCICSLSWLGAVWSAPQKPRSSQSVDVTYIANAGVMVSHAENNILIDAFSINGNPYYLRISENILQNIETAKSPFNRINAVFVTHLHADHHDSGAIMQLLKNSPETVLVAPRQLCLNFISTLSLDFYEMHKRQIHAVWQGFGNAAHDSVGTMQITVLGLHHGSQKYLEIQNAGFLLNMDGIKILHIGDAEATSINFKPFHLRRKQIDLAFIPYWFLIYTRHNRQIVDDYIHPKQIVVIHIPPTDEKEILNKLHKYYPEAKPLTKPLQKLKFYFEQ